MSERGDGRVLHTRHEDGTALGAVEIGVRAGRSERADRVDVGCGQAFDQTAVGREVDLVIAQRSEWEGAEAGEHASS